MKWINTLTKISLTAIAFVTVAIPAAQAGTFTFKAGLPDNFSSANGLELANPSDGLQISMGNSYNANNRWGSRDYTADFDGKEVNQIFGHTFDLNALGLPKEKIKSAQLDIKLKALGSSLTSNDSIGFVFADDAGDLDSIRWGRRIGSDSSVDGLLSTRWGSGSTHTFTFDLANLPLASNQDPNQVPSDLMAILNEKRFLDIMVADDTAIDYIELRVDVPEPASVLGLMGLTALGSLLRISKREKVTS